MTENGGGPEGVEAEPSAVDFLCFPWSQCNPSVFQEPFTSSSTLNKMAATLSSVRVNAVRQAASARPAPARAVRATVVASASRRDALAALVGAASLIVSEQAFAVTSIVIKQASPGRGKESEGRELGNLPRGKEDRQ